MLNSIGFRTACLFTLMLCATGVVAQQPVIPGASGFGIDTPAGRGGTVFRVTNLNDSGGGSLRSCVDASGPRVCIFEVSGTIRLNSVLNVDNPKLTIAGQTAPSPGIMIRGATFKIKASDVFVQHIAFRTGDDPNGPDPGSRDTVFVGGPNPVQNVVIDHCSISWSIDENLNFYRDTDNVTVSNSIIAQPLHDSLHPKGPHGYGVLFNSTNGNSRFTLVGNLIAQGYARNPRSNAANFVFVNNVVYNVGSMAVMLFTDQGSPSRNSLVGNVFLDGPNGSPPPIRLSGPSDGNGTNTILPGTQIYLADNSAPGANSDQWSMVRNESNVSLSSLRENSAPTWPSGLQALPTSGGVALDSVLSNAGSRPSQRNSVDAKVISHVRNRDGQYVNCVAADGSSRCARNGGGWPQLAANSRPLNLPGNPNGDNDGDGYTNLEEWLHDMAAEVEGGVAPTALPPSASTAPLPPEFL